MRLIALLVIFTFGSFVSFKSEAKMTKIAFKKKSCGEWTNYYNNDGNVSYRIRQCDGYSQMQTFR